MDLRKLRLALWGLVALVGIGVGLFLLLSKPAEAPLGEVRTTTFQESIGGDWELIDASGQAFGSEDLEGRPHAVFFGFTHCPDICPNTLSRLARLRQDLGEDSFDIVFISVDPERDGPEEVGKYAELFGTPIIGLTGTPGQIEAVKEKFAVVSETVALDDGSYTVDHTSNVFLFDEAGRFTVTISPEEGRQPALEKLRRIAA